VVLRRFTDQGEADSVVTDQCHSVSAPCDVFDLGFFQEYFSLSTGVGEPNQGIDTLSIKTDSYEAAGNVQHGNVQLHKQELVP